MQLLRELGVKIRRKETPFYASLYGIAKSIRGFSIPVIKPVHSALYAEWALRTNLWHEFWRTVYYEPMFKSQCKEVGSGFKMWYAGNGCSRIFGNLDIYLGDNVTIFDNSSFTGLKVFDDPKLEIGNNTYIGPLARFMVAKNIKIGSFTIVTSSFIADNSAHSVSNAFARMASGYGGPSLKGIKPVVIGDLCWLAAGSRIYPGAQIGDGVVAKLDTHVKGMIPPFCLIEGNPCKIVGKLPIPEELKEHFGEDRYRLWKEQQDAVKLD